MKEFTANNSVWTIRNCKEFKSFKKYIICPRIFAPIMQVYKIKHLQLFFRINPPSLVRALNIMRKRINNGEKIFYLLDKNNEVALYFFLIGHNKPFVLILLGGGYGDVCSLVEGYEIAIKLNELGYNAFIGQYRVGKKALHPNPQDDVATFINFINNNAHKMSVDTKGYAIIGSSAGGHLAGSWGLKTIGYDKYNLPKPQTLILAYPVITMGEKTHVGSRNNLLGKDKNNIELQKLYSIEKNIDKDYPPTFVWQCKEDNVVTLENSILLTDALKANNIPYEYVQIEGKEHGLGLGIGSKAEGWLDKAVAFWNKQK